MSVYSVDKLMAQTRKQAAECRQMTGQPLPVTAEIINYDAARLVWCHDEGTVNDQEVWESTP